MRQYNKVIIQQTNIKELDMNINSLRESLMEFHVPNSDLLNNNDFSSIHRKNSCLFYLICLLLSEISWIMLILACHSYFFKVTQILGFLIVWVLIWAIIGFKKHFMYKEQFLFWCQAIFHAFMYFAAKLSQNYHFILCGCCMGIILFIVLQLIITKKSITTKFFFYLYVWYVGIFYKQMKQMDYQKDVSWLTMGILDFYLIIASIFMILIMKKYVNFSKPARWQLLLLFYPLSIILVLCMAGTFPERFSHIKWIWFTIINHTVFVLLIYFVYKNKQILPKLFSFKKANEQVEEDHRQKLFQISDILLAVDQDHIQNQRQSMKGGRPLADCTLCLSQQSCFCYGNCKHACVGINCVRPCLQQNIRKCPFCRLQSNNIFHIQRLSGVHFAVNGKYKFKG